MSNNIKKIMIIDDSELDCYITSKVISNLDETIDIMEFNSGVIAIQYLEAYQNLPENLPDLIFLDIYMPLINGFDFIEKFKTFSNIIKEHSKICILSSTIDDMYIHKAKLSTSVMFTNKPLTKEFFRSILN